MLAEEATALCRGDDFCIEPPLHTSGRYKKAGGFVTDEYGSPDTSEFLNIAKDDALAFPAVAIRVARNA